MRISDWSSDVCSSDLQPQVVGAARVRRELIALLQDVHRRGDLLLVVCAHFLPADRHRRVADTAQHAVRGLGLLARQHREARRCAERAEQRGLARALDRKSVVWGKSVAVRVDIGGRRIIKKKKTKKNYNNN